MVMSEKIWEPKWLGKLKENELQDSDFHMKFTKTTDPISNVVENTNHEKETQEVTAAKTRLTQVIQTTIEAALVLEGTLLDNMGQSISVWTGSAFLIQPNIAITNAHTILVPDTQRGESVLHIVSLDGEDFYKVKVLARSEEIDISVIEIIDFPGTTYLTLGNSDEVEQGEMLVVLGAPEGWQNNASVGYVSNIDQTLDDADKSWQNLLFTDAYIANGSSGGAVVDMEGNVIGIVMGIIGSHSRVGVGQNALISIDKVKSFLTQSGISYDSN